MYGKKLIAIILTVLLVAYCGIAFLLYDESSAVPILCYSGSYAEEWAEDNHIPHETLADSEACLGVLNLEFFDYNLNAGTCTIMDYRGDSTSIAIPVEIDGYLVQSVDENAFQNNTALKEVYVPETVLFYGPIYHTDILVHTYENSPAEEQLTAARQQLDRNLALQAKAEEARTQAEEQEQTADEAEALAVEARKTADALQQAERPIEAEAAAEAAKQAAEATAQADAAEAAAEEARSAAETAEKRAEELEAQIQDLDFREVASQVPILDSYYVDFRSTSTSFSYNNLKDGLELVRYDADGEIIVPSSVNGQKVTAISFPVLHQGIDAVLIPETVEQINVPFSAPRYDAIFWVNLAILVCAYLFAIVLTVRMFRDDSALETKFLGVSIGYTGLKYFLLLLLWAGFSLLLQLRWILQLVVAVVLLILGVIESTKAAAAVKIVRTQSMKTKVQTQFIHLFADRIENLMQNTEQEKVKQVLSRLYEAVRYSDPVSCQEVRSLEEQMDQTFSLLEGAVSRQETQELVQIASRLERLIRERNTICKQMK